MCEVVWSAKIFKASSKSWALDPAVTDAYSNVTPQEQTVLRKDSVYSRSLLVSFSTLHSLTKVVPVSLLIAVFPELFLNIYLKGS